MRDGAAPGHADGAAEVALEQVGRAFEIAGDGPARWTLELNPLTQLINVAREALLYGGPVGPGDIGLALLGPAIVTGSWQIGDITHAAAGRWFRLAEDYVRLATILDRAGGDPTVVCGATPLGAHCGGRPGNGRAIFVTLEDEYGGLNLLIWADLAERQRRILLEAQLLGRGAHRDLGGAVEPGHAALDGRGTARAAARWFRRRSCWA